MRSTRRARRLAAPVRTSHRRGRFAAIWRLKFRETWCTAPTRWRTPRRKSRSGSRTKTWLAGSGTRTAGSSPATPLSRAARLDIETEHARDRLISRVFVFDSRAALLNTNHHRRFAPQPFEVVVAPFFWQEGVHDNIAVVHQDPAVFRVTFCSPGENSEAIF